ncbi:dephospho-CoA kinase [Pedobacter panaciterrae]|jgi:dephospho-CoA kinase|uniref:dephospho-CoA kinase n=1 Tax=Pedobacter panaciterrae TaxID=363849 RepID=UPI00155DBE7E|nr:dephospho-CoA kinase [Pedobacter panaciterrae]NQX52618.1 dephospho-CoA kinase [Pedobacter panaciterrae]
MLKVGITGGIGSGKTTICKIFETLGVSVFYADTVAKEIMVNDAILIQGVKDTFGKESYLPGDILNNKHIAGIVFNDAGELAKLNALVHPAVFRAFDNWVNQLPEKVPYILKEAALLFESGSYRMCDKNILVTAPLELKLDRVMKRDRVTADQVKARMDKQFTDEKKIQMADYLINNNETDSLINQVMGLHQLFLNTKP